MHSPNLDRAERGASALDKLAASRFPAAWSESTTPSMPPAKSQVPSIANCEADVLRLAQLSPFEYDNHRSAEAKRLGCRTGTLDKAVRAARGTETSSVAGQPLSFPDVEPWPHPVDGAVMLDEITEICARYLGLPKHGDAVVALWVAMTYLADVLDCMPMLFITAPEKGCGKSTVLDVVQRLAFKTLSTSNITAASLFRAVELCAPTLLIDEVDSFLRGNEEMRGIINSGHTRSAAFVIRNVEVDGNHEPRQFSTWSPKALAGIGRQHGTIEDRSVIVTMQRLPPEVKLEKLRSRIGFPELRRKLVRWCADHANEIADAPLRLTDGLHNRAADNWHPLYAIAESAGGRWPQRVRDTAAEFAGANIADSIGTELLRAIHDVFTSTAQKRISTVRLIELLCEDETARWCDYGHGYPITSPQVAKLLKKYGIKSKAMRGAEVDKVVKGYDVVDFTDAFARYLATLDPAAANSAVTQSQVNKDDGFHDSGLGYIPEAVTDCKFTEVADDAALSPCNRPEAPNPAGDADDSRAAADDGEETL